MLFGLFEVNEAKSFVRKDKLLTIGCRIALGVELFILYCIPDMRCYLIFALKWILILNMWHLLFDKVDNYISESSQTLH